MSIDLMSRVWKSDAYQGGTLLVLLALADWADDDGTRIFPKVETLAKKARLSDRQTRNCLKSLRDDGVLVEVAAARRGRPTEYRMNLNAMKKLQGNNCTAKITPEISDAVALQSATVALKSATPHIDNHQLSTIEPSTLCAGRESESGQSVGLEKPPRDDSEPDWPRIWTEFRKVPGLPKGVSEREAKKAYLRLVAQGEAPTVDELIRAIASWATETAEQQRARTKGKLYVKHPHNWLAEKCFQGYLEAERALENAPDPCAEVIAGLGDGVVARLRAAGLTDGEINAYFVDAEFDQTSGPRFVVLSEFKCRQIGDKFGPRLRRNNAFGPTLAIIVEGDAA
jgi:hypothetical protein